MKMSELCEIESICKNATIDCDKSSRGVCSEKVRFYLIYMIGTFLMNSVKAQEASSPANILDRPKLGVTAIILNDKREVLMAKRKGALAHGVWGFPGGHIEYEESIEKAIHREVLEETGLVIESLIARKDFWTRNTMTSASGNKDYFTFFVIVTNFTGIPQNNEPDKLEPWQWIPLQELAPGSNSDISKHVFCPITTFMAEYFEQLKSVY